MHAGCLYPTIFPLNREEVPLIWARCWHPSWELVWPACLRVAEVRKKASQYPKILQVSAVGWSWITPQFRVSGKNVKRMTKLAKSSLLLANAIWCYLPTQSIYPVIWFASFPFSTVSKRKSPWSPWVVQSRQRMATEICGRIFAISTIPCIHHLRLCRKKAIFELKVRWIVESVFPNNTEKIGNI